MLGSFIRIRVQQGGNAAGTGWVGGGLHASYTSWVSGGVQLHLCLAVVLVLGSFIHIIYALHLCLCLAASYASFTHFICACAWQLHLCLCWAASYASGYKKVAMLQGQDGWVEGCMPVTHRGYLEGYMTMCRFSTVGRWS